MEYNNTLSLNIDLLGNRLYIVTAILAVVVAIGVRHIIVHRWQYGKSVDPHSTFTDGSTDTKAANVKTRQSRLLRKQFGIIEDDLQLYEEIATTIDDDVASPVDLKKDEVDMHLESKTFTYETETKLDDNDDTQVIKSDIQLHETAVGAETDLDDSEEANTAPTKEDPLSPPQQTQQHSLTIVSPPSSPVAAMQMKSKKKDDKYKSQYERLQGYRRQQMLLAAESRLEHQRQFRSERNLPPLFHFWTWFDTQASLYRQYTFVREDGIEDNTTIVPYHPSSRRSDKISIQLRITNEMDVPISVYWIDHIGKHIPKGIILSHGGTWQQTTYVDHPWIFKTTTTTTIDDQLDDKTERVILHYIPHQLIPSTMDEPALDSEMESATNVINGIHRFHIIPSVAGEPLIYNCAVRDPVLPYPASNHIFTARKAAEYALQHCIRMRYDKWMILQKYIQNIIDFPNDIQYRCIRIANPKFSDYVWNTPAKGVLLAYNFIEQSDTGYVCFGGMINTDEKDVDENQNELPIETLQELQLLLHMIHLSERKAKIEYGFQ